MAPDCESASLQNKGDPCVAMVWDGGRWEKFTHGRRRCKKCAASHRVSYVWVDGRKYCTITKKMFESKSENPALLVSNYVGYRLNYLRQQTIRQFRCAESLLGEASTILATYEGENRITETRLSMHLASAIQLYFCFQEGRFANLDVEKPILDDDPVLGEPNKGFHTIFDAWSHDPDFDKTIKERDVVSDGNKVLTRLLCPVEQKIRTNPAGKPKTMLKKPSAASAVRKCTAVANQEHQASAVDPKKKRIEGVYARIDKKSGEILHFAEMLNPERGDYKEQSIRRVSSHCKVGSCCLDCACKHGDWEGVFCRRCLLDKWHSFKHKCDPKKFDPRHKANIRFVRGRNTSGAEQLWSRTDSLAKFLMQHRRVFSASS